MKNENLNTRAIARILIPAAAAVLIAILALGCIRSVPTGFTGILTTFGRVDQGSLDAGIHFKAPWQKIVLMDNRVQKGTVDTEAFSADIQAVDVTLTITYSINRATAAGLYETVGTNYYATILYPQLLENTKTVFGQYTAEGLIDNRDGLADQIVQRMRTAMNDFGIQIGTISIENLDFSDRFTDAIEAKQVATQELQRATTQQQQATMETTAAAEREKISANAQAEVARINADAEAYAISAHAEAEAEANRKISESLTDQLIEYTQAQNWDGSLPQTYAGSGDTLPILGLNP